MYIYNIIYIYIVYIYILYIYIYIYVFYCYCWKKKETWHEYFLPCRPRISITPIYQHIGNPKPPHPAHMRPIHALPVQGTFMVATWNGGSAFSAKRFMSSSITTKPEVRLSWLVKIAESVNYRMGPPFDSVQLPHILVAEFYGLW